MKRIVIALLITEMVVAQNIKISVEKRFEPFVKSLKKQGLRFDIQDKNSSLEAFEDIKNSKASFAIVRGDILADNMESKNFFKNESFQDFRIVSKLKENHSSFLYLISKNSRNNAYEVLNPESRTGKVKKISIGYLKDLSIIYLADIARSVDSSYRFHYRSFSPKESLKKLQDGELDACYLFTSPQFASHAQQSGFSISNIEKPVKMKDENFATKIKEQKSFVPLNHAIRVDNYLIASSTISDSVLKPMVATLKKSGDLGTNIKPEMGQVDLRVASLSVKIEQEEATAKAEAEQKEKELKEEEEEHEKECKDANNQAKMLPSEQGHILTIGKSVNAKIKELSSKINSNPDLSYFKSQITPKSFEVKLNLKDSNILIKNIKKFINDCESSYVMSSMNELRFKTSELKSIQTTIYMIESEIGKQLHIDEKEINDKQERELKEYELIEKEAVARAEILQQNELEKEARARAEELHDKAVEKLEEEAKAQAEEASKGFFEKLFN